mmetsp:Transcript_40246/g.130728  ORF Transcript_40246/g.130728 Transcript_40246/m.130728 type:complete len:202 (+) Transcript_40246:320-925(+)
MHEAADRPARGRPRLKRSIVHRGAHALRQRHHRRTPPLLHMRLEVRPASPKPPLPLARLEDCGVRPSARVDAEEVPKGTARLRRSEVGKAYKPLQHLVQLLSRKVAAVVRHEAAECDDWAEREQVRRPPRGRGQLRRERYMAMAPEAAALHQEAAPQLALLRRINASPPLLAHLPRPEELARVAAVAVHVEYQVGHEQEGG